MTPKEIELVVNCLALALHGNGGRHGGMIEREIFANFLRDYPEAADELLERAFDWVRDDELVKSRYRSVFNYVINRS